MSNRLTFSLASLILIFTLVLVATPVMAQGNSPTVMITEHLGRDTLGDISTDARTVQERDDFRVLLTFSHPVDALAAEDVQFRLFNLVDGRWNIPANIAAAPTAIDTSGATTTTGDLTRFVVTVNGGAVSATTTNTRVEIIVGGGVTQGTTSPNHGPNSGARAEFALPTVLTAEASFGMPMEVAGQISQYTVDVTFTNTTPLTGDPVDQSLDNAAPISPGTNDLVAAFINVMPAGADVVVGGGTPMPATGTTAGEAGKTIYPLTVTLRSGVDSVTLSINPGYATAAATMGTVTVPTSISAPTNVVATAQSNGNIDVSWAWAGTATNLMHFALTWDNGGSATVAAGTMTHTIGRASLSPGTSYTVNVMAVATADSDLLNSAAVPSNSVTARTPQGPAAPANFRATANDAANTISVSWTQVAGITYALTHASNAPMANATSPTVFGPTPALPQGAAISFSITATDADGLVSSASTATAMLKMDVQPTVDISTLSHSTNSVTVRFTFAQATMVYGADGTSMALNAATYDARPVPTTLAGSMINVTTDAAGMNPANIAAPPGGVRLNNPNVFDVTIDYSGASLPLYVTLKNAANHVSAIGLDGGNPMPVTATSTPALMLTSSKTATIPIPTANSSSPVINVGQYFDNAMIPAYGYAVLVRDFNSSGLYSPLPNTWLLSNNASLPDLAWFFGGDGGPNTGTIALRKTAGGAHAKDLIISEIMWGTDSSLAMPACSQWIEFYNATPNPINLNQFTIQFHRSLAFPNLAGAIDTVSNVGHVYFGYHEFPGQSGRSTAVDSQNRFAQPVNLVSMRRSLNHERIRTQNVGNRGERNKGIGGWSPSVFPTANVSPYHVATPGADQLIRTRLGNSSPRQHVIINEIGNSSNDANDWIELYNTTGSGVNIENWEFMRVTARSGGGGVESFIARFPKVTIPANSYVVITRTHPRDQGNDLAAGIDLARGDADQLNRGLGSKPDSKVAYYLVDSELKLANDTNRCLYILRHGHDREGQPTHIEDVVGTLKTTLKGPSTNRYTWYSANDLRIWDTDLWPLQGRGGPHGNVIDHGDEDFRPGRVYQRNGKNSGTGEKQLSVRGYTGIGYDRMAAVNNENGGTPGYSNGALRGDKSNWADQVSFSEIMLVTHTDADDGRVPRATRLPQWLEIYNSSMTEGVSINNWYLEVQNADTEDLDTRDLHGTLRLPNITIPPNQTILITTSAGLNSGHFPDQRLINLFLNGTYRNILTIQTRGDSVLSQVGFYIELRDHKGNHVDEIGNLAVRHSDPRRGVEVRDQGNFSTTWDIPGMVTEDGRRTSLIRIYDNGKPRDGLMGVGGPKQTDTSWILASNTQFRRVPNVSYYGNHLDLGTPGYRGGGPLPVGLSMFRPQRLDDGSVLIRWVTASETNNAGFNILRSDTRDGEFKKLNTQLIAGQGTTSERTAYEFTDKSAKPNVVHYYQIQDVSIDGNVTTLQTTHLRGHVSATGKATTTWGKLKALQ